MENVQGLSGIFGSARVNERAGGNRGDGRAFRRALEQGGSGRDEAAADGEAPVRPGLQRRPANGRKDDGATFHHVDVIA